MCTVIKRWGSSVIDLSQHHEHQICDRVLVADSVQVTEAKAWQIALEAKRKFPYADYDEE